MRFTLLQHASRDPLGLYQAPLSPARIDPALSPLIDVPSSPIGPTPVPTLHSLPPLFSCREHLSTPYETRSNAEPVGSEACAREVWRADRVQILLEANQQRGAEKARQALRAEPSERRRSRSANPSCWPAREPRASTVRRAGKARPADRMRRAGPPGRRNIRCARAPSSG